MVAKNRVLQFYRKNTCQKRGGKQRDLSLDDFVLPDYSADPDRDFDRRWTYRLLELTKNQLEHEYAERGRKDWFDALFPSITSDEGAVSYLEIAKKINSTEGAVKVASHRMRQKYRDVLRSQVAKTVASEAEVDEELQTLCKVLSGE